MLRFSVMQLSAPTRFVIVFLPKIRKESAKSGKFKRSDIYYTLSFKKNQEDFQFFS